MASESDEMESEYVKVRKYRYVERLSSLKTNGWNQIINLLF